ncbi:MAG: hypothetical protein KIS75_14105 [Chromatiales bacterium]|nr:hypothetical protein [Chromatiales bacterium]
MKQKKIVVGTVAITRGSRVPILNNGLLVVVVHVGHRMDINRYRIRLLTGAPFPQVDDLFYKMLTAKISAARLLPIDDTPHEQPSVATLTMIERARRAGGHEVLANSAMAEELRS